MLANDFYYTIEKRLTDTGFEVDIRFNKTHKIYQVHFPENPITPGVCIVQIAKDLLETHYKTPLLMTLAKNIKFLSVIYPTDEVCFKITNTINEEGLIAASIVVEKNQTSYTKISALFKKLA